MGTGSKKGAQGAKALAGKVSGGLSRLKPWPRGEGSPVRSRFRQVAPKLAGVLVVLLVAIMVLISVQNVDVLLVYDEEAAFEDILALEEIGPRVTGSDAELRGAEYTASVMRDIGLQNVHIEEYEQTLYEVNSASMSLLVREQFSPTWTRTVYRHGHDFYLTSFSGSTAGTVSYEVVDVGHANDDDYQGVAAGGRAVIATKVGASQTQLRQACNHGATVNIMHNHHHSEHLGYVAYQGGTYASDPTKTGVRTYPDDNSDCLLPSMVVSLAVGKQIREAINDSVILPGVGSNVLIELDFDVTIERRPVRVVVGDHVGETKPDEVILFGGHLDTPYLSPGASDDGEGVVTTLAIARSMQGYRTERTIRFLAMGGEEEGTLGSQRYVQEHFGNNGETWVHMTNFDVNGVPLKYGNLLTIHHNDNESLERFQDLQKRYTKQEPELWAPYEVEYRWEQYPGVDARAFSKAGVPASWASGICPNLHTIYDTVYDTFHGTDELEVSPESWGLSVRILGSNGLILAGPLGYEE